MKDNVHLLLGALCIGILVTMFANGAVNIFFTGSLLGVLWSLIIDRTG